MQGRADFDLPEEIAGPPEFNIYDYIDPEDLNKAIVARVLNYSLQDDELEYEIAVGYDDDGEYFDTLEPGEEDPDDLYELVDEWMDEMPDEDDYDEDDWDDEDDDVEWYDDDEDWGDDEEEDDDWEDEEDDEDDDDIDWE